MTYLPKRPCFSGVAILLAAGLTLSACATKPERRGPPPDRQSDHKGGGPAKTSGTFMQPIAALFIGMDANQDKVVSLSEMQSSTQSEWATFGRNPSATYFAQWSITNLGSTDAMPTFMSFDRDFSGTVSEGEFSDQLEREFTRLDKNSDGNLERSEMIVAFAAPRGEKARKGGGKEKGGKGGRGGQGGGRPPR